MPDNGGHIGLTLVGTKDPTFGLSLVGELSLWAVATYCILKDTVPLCTRVLIKYFPTLIILTNCVALANFTAHNDNKYEDWQALTKWMKMTLEVTLIKVKILGLFLVTLK